MAYNNQQSSLQNVCSYSFTAQNLFSVSLVKDTDPNLPSYKRAFFCFLTLAPGEAGNNGGRTYNFSNKINMKQDLHQVLSLAHAVRNVAAGRAHLNGKFSLFVDTSKSSYGGGAGMVKQVFVNPFPKPNPQQPPAADPKVSLGFRIGKEQPKGMIWSVPEALAVADILEGISKKGIQLDMNHSMQIGAQPPAQTNQNSYKSNNGYQQSSAPPPQEQRTGPPKTNQQTYQQPANPPPQNQQPVNTNQQSYQQPNTVDNIVNNFQDGLNDANNGGGSGATKAPPMQGHATAPPMTQNNNMNQPPPNDDIPF